MVVRVIVLATATLLAVPASFACTGDCDGDNTVSIDELMKGVNVALGMEGVELCPFFDRDSNDAVTVDEVLAGITADLAGCPLPSITTVAGNGLAGLNGDGHAPLDSALYLPQDGTVGPDGNIYFADWNNHRIRRIKDGVVETIAGTGELGEGRDGLALYVQFNHPTNVTFDAQGRLLIAAWHNSLVKRLDLATGYVENVCGTGARSFGGDGGPANSAALDLPSSVLTDSQGNIIISDQANFRLRKVNAEGVVSTICGSTRGYSGDGGPAGAAQLSSPIGQSAPPAGRIDIDSQDRIYIADTGNHAVRMIDTDGTIYTIAGTGQPGYSGDDGPATAAQLDTPSDIAVTGNGILYIADTMNHVIRKVAPDGTITTVAGTGERGFSGDGGPANTAELDRPYGVAVARNGDLYAFDTHNQRIRLISSAESEPPPTPVPTPPPTIIPCTDVAGSICTYAGNGGSGYDGEGHHRLEITLYWPLDIEFTPSGRRIFMDWNNHLVREILPDETIQTIMGSDFVGDGPADLSDLTPEGADPLTVDLNHPTDVQELSNGDLAVTAWHNHKIRIIDAETGRVRVVLGAGAGFAGDGGPAKDARVNQPPHAVLDPNGNLFLVDQRSQRIRVLRDFDAMREQAVVATVVGNGTKGFNGDGIALETQMSQPAGPNPEPGGSVALDAQGRLYFADTQNHRIRRVEFITEDFTSGLVTTLAGTGTGGFNGDGPDARQAQVNNPEDLEIGPDGNLYFTDTNNDRIRRINLITGAIDTVVGNGVRGYSGDGGSALEASLNRPFGIAFDEAGDLYVSDTFNGRIRKVKLAE
jgi:sugar lactone lactonase YvrE